MLRPCVLDAFALGLLAVGCGGGGDDDSHGPGGAPSGLAGMYQTMTTTTSSPCDAAATPDINQPVYFQIKDEQSFGEAYVAVYPCDAADASSCEEFADIDFATQASDGTFDSEELGLSSDGSAAPASCDGEYTTAVITKTAGGVSISTKARTGSLAGVDLCKVDQDFTAQQEAAIKALPCTSQTTAVATRL
jgi:hypothetical protein